MHNFEGNKSKYVPRDINESNEGCVIDVEGTDHQGVSVNE